MALAYEDLRISPRNDVSVFEEAASLDSPELAISASSDCGDVVQKTTKPPYSSLIMLVVVLVHLIVRSETALVAQT
jgi:hypothetical protein